jgi:hypothetical protein
MASLGREMPSDRVGLRAASIIDQDLTGASEMSP